MKTIVVTGYSSSIALQLFNVLNEKQEQIKILRCGRNRDANIFVDFSSIKQTKKFITQLQKISPDYLFLNHGVLPGVQICDLKKDELINSVSVNLVSYLLIIESLTKLDNLRTVVMSSISGKVGSYDTLYAATKAGIDVTVRRIASCIPHSSRLNAVSPGIISDAKMTTVRTDLDVLENKRINTPTKQFTTSLDVAKLIYYVLFEATNLLGENINLNGGMYIK
jgi:NAD(P)-dependent dehydrogenase (short-subunit alcohol dehydrogenase family)